MTARWRDLQSWWQNREHITDPGEAKKSLYARLRASLPENSPGQRNLFESYHRILGSEVYDMPALLPEVWLHWDPRTVRERGPQALLRFRLDFLLLLLPHGQRIVLEVDGSQHYTRDRGHTPDTAKYAAMVAADRDLRLSGYEVYRFGHDELRGETTPAPSWRLFFPGCSSTTRSQAGTDTQAGRPTPRRAGRYPVGTAYRTAGDCAVGRSDGRSTSVEL
ncbi:hypothetical protein ACWEKU_12325 [Streptomyces californicus]